MRIDRKTHSDSPMECLTSAQKDAACTHCQTATIRDAILWLRQEFKISASLRLCARLFPDIHSLEIARSHISYTDQIPPHCASLSKHVPLVPSVLSLPPNQAAAARCAST